MEFKKKNSNFIFTLKFRTNELKLTILTLRSHTTGEFHGSHTGSILTSQFQKIIARKLSVRCGSKNYGTRFEHSRLSAKSRFVRKHTT